MTTPPPETPDFSHLDEQGRARMVDVGGKPPIKRTASAQATLLCAPETLTALRAKALPKGDVLATATLAGILAAKRTDELIPLCHTLPLDDVGIEFTMEDASVTIVAHASTVARTGVEMEALTAVSVAALTLYDMCKAVDKSMRIDGLHVLSKTKEASA